MITNIYDSIGYPYLHQVFDTIFSSWQMYSDCNFLLTNDFLTHIPAAYKPEIRKNAGFYAAPRMHVWFFRYVSSALRHLCNQKGYAESKLDHFGTVNRNPEKYISINSRYETRSIYSEIFAIPQKGVHISTPAKPHHLNHWVFQFVCRPQT